MLQGKENAPIFGQYLVVALVGQSHGRGCIGLFGAHLDQFSLKQRALRDGRPVGDLGYSFASARLLGIVER